MTINVPVDDYIEIAQLCRLSNAKMSDYGRALFSYAINHHLLAGPNLNEQEKWFSAIKEGNGPLPKISLEIKAGPPSKLSLYQEEAGASSHMVAEDPPKTEIKKNSAG